MKNTTKTIKYHHILYMVIVLSTLAVPILSNNTNALGYSSSAGLNFTINPSISVSVSGDLIIDELAPGSSSDSNVINVTVLSNNSTGYTLSSTIGSSTNNYTDLRLNSNGSANGNNSDSGDSNSSNNNENINKFTNLDTNKASLSNFDDNYWGYSYSVDSGTNWISGNTGSTANGYNGLPIYSSTGIKLVDTTAIGTNTIKFKIGAKASNTQAAGEYTNTVNFTAVGKATPVSFYDAFTEAASTNPNITMYNGYYKMQDMSSSICAAVSLYDDASHAQLIDTRDNEVYWIGKLKDNRCWLLDNLRLGSNDYEIPLTPQDTNIAEDWTLPHGITRGLNSYTTAQINAGGTGNLGEYTKNTIATHYGNGSGKVGVYYNFCAASAGSYCYDSSSSSGNASEDICPTNWRIPTGGNDPAEYQVLYTAYSSNVTNFRNALSTPLSGRFYGSSQTRLGSSGRFFSSTRSDDIYMYGLYVDSDSVDQQSIGNRRNGHSIRCIANNE